MRLCGPCAIETGTVTEWREGGGLEETVYIHHCIVFLTDRSPVESRQDPTQHEFSHFQLIYLSNMEEMRSECNQLKPLQCLLMLLRFISILINQPSVEEMGVLDTNHSKAIKVTVAAFNSSVICKLQPLQLHSWKILLGSLQKFVEDRRTQSRTRPLKKGE